MTNKLIRECRMGPPKSFKTGAVVGSYPKPMLYLGFDQGGITVVPPKGRQVSNGEMIMDSCFEDIVHIKPREVKGWLSKEQPKILAVDYNTQGTADIDLFFRPAPNSAPFQNFIFDYNELSTYIRSTQSVPWRTVVFDSVTGYEDLILNHISQSNPQAMEDARRWAGQTGGKVRQTIITLCTWPCHVVFIMHSQIEKNETTGTVTELPSVFSNLRSDIGGLFSQFFYAVKNNGQPKIWPHDRMFVRGVGARWPSGLGAEINPDFNSIYGKELA
jgi:hypothetical protein